MSCLVWNLGLVGLDNKVDNAPNEDMVVDHSLDRELGTINSWSKVFTSS